MLKDMVTILAWLALFTTLVGMYKPWIVLWWVDIKNRKMVLKYYGVAVLVLFVVRSFL
jgi:hypothetical protein